ncbi:MAG TPA: peptide-methionine (S)-S-oxide reductase MsrA [Vicinamibacterales bacterium]|nr:peptide-methionine (S)-S-oxide reductase MsrA [Vicinamibacterales bacterium]
MPDAFPDPLVDIPAASEPGGEATAVLAGGCFWCVEAVYLQLDGVRKVVSGYAGGTAETANYEAVCTGRTNHAEAVRIHYDPARITYGQLLKVFFWIAHDPTHLNRQGNDVGRQYRSAIFYADERQKEVAEGYIRQLDAARTFPAPVATTLEPLDAFYEAEAYHQNYAARNPAQPYVAFVAAPKVEKLRTYLGDRLARKTR